MTKGSRVLVVLAVLGIAGCAGARSEAERGVECC
jgi:hypothetical protein